MIMRSGGVIHCLVLGVGGHERRCFNLSGLHRLWYGSGPLRVSIFDLNMYVYFCTGIGCGVESMSFNAMGKDVPDLSWDLVRPFCSLV